MPRQTWTQPEFFDTKPKIRWTQLPPRVQTAVNRLLAKMLVDHAEQSAGQARKGESDER